MSNLVLTKDQWLASHVTDRILLSIVGSFHLMDDGK